MKAGTEPFSPCQATSLVQGVVEWFRLNTRFPGWMPPRWRHPLVAYLLTVLLVVVALLLDFLLLALLPAFAFIDLPILFLVLGAALLWGAGPALFATLLGTFLLYYVVYPPHFALHWKYLIDLVESGGVMIGGLFITLVVMHQDAQRRALAQWAQEEAALRAKLDAFLMLTSHELRTPLTLIQLHLQRTRRMFASAPKKGESTITHLERVVQQGDAQMAVALEYWARLNQLVTSLLELTWLQTDQGVCHRQSVDLLPLLKRMVDQQHQSAHSPTIDLLLPPIPSIRVIADPNQLEQVLKNYLANAIKFSPEGTPVTVGASVEAGHVRVWVRDQGPGLPVIEQARIWERFYRVPNIEVQNGSSMGLGIGLYLCQKIIEGHQGTVGVASAPGQGSTFWFTLPLALAAPE